MGSVHSEAEWARTVDPVTQVELLVPPYSTVEATVARAAKLRAGQLHEVRLFPDHGHGWPLWDPKVGYTAVPDDYGLSEGLVAALRQWYDDWEAAVGPGDGWSDAAEKEEWIERGDDLAARLVEETWDIAVIVPRFRLS